MSKRFSILLIILVIISGLVGGALSGRIFAVKPAMAVETTQSKVLTVEGLRFVDRSGQLRMEINEDNKNGYGLFIYDDSNSVKAIMGVGQFGGVVCVNGKDSIGKAVMQVNEACNGSFGAFSKVGKGVASMSAFEDSGVVSVLGKDDKSGVVIGADESGGKVSAFGKDGRRKSAMGAFDDSGSVLVSGRAGNVIIIDKDDNQVVSIGAEESGGCVNILGKDNEIIARMGVGVNGNGIIGVSGRDGNDTASIQIFENGAGIGVTGKGSKSGAIMQVGKHGGMVNVFDNDGKIKASINVNEYGNGVIGLWDKNGYRLK